MIDNDVRFALHLFDEFDGALIRDVAVRFVVNGVELRPLLKKDGFYVFCGAIDLPATVQISRAHYLDTTLNVLKDSELVPVVDVRLLRRAPGVWQDCTWIEASKLANTEAIAISQREAFKIHAANNNDDIPLITLAASTVQSLSGRRFCDSKDPGDSFLVLRMVAPGQYEVDHLPKAGNKGSYARAYLSRSDEQGHVAIPVEGGAAQPKEVWFAKGGNKWDRVSATELC
jgi:hypothetical protein